MTYKPTALERRHPLVVARKRAEAKHSQAEAWYRDGCCTACGWRLADYDLASGFEMCGQCEEDTR